MVSKKKKLNQRTLQLDDIEIVFHSNFPLNEIAKYAKLFNKYKLLFPKWLQSLRVFWKDQTDDDTTMQITARPEYKTAWLDIFHRTLENEVGEDETLFEDHLLHELCHLVSYPLYHLSTITLDELMEGDDKTMKKLILDGVRAENESCTQELVGIMKRFYK